METLSVSAMSLFQTCARKYQLSKELGILPKYEDTEATSDGKLWHEVMHQYFRGTYRHEEIEQTVRKEFPNFDTDDSEHFRCLRLIAAFRSYVKRYFPNNWKILSIEEEFFNPLLNPEPNKRQSESRTFQMHGFKDMIIIDEDGERAMVDHKFTSSMKPEQMIKYHFEFQSNYYGINDTTTRIIFDCVGKPKLVQGGKRGRDSETDDAFIQRLIEWYDQPDSMHREVVYYDQTMLHDTHVKAWQLAQDILRARREGVWVTNTGSCFDFNSPCKYFALCSSNMNPVILERDYTTPEQREETNGTQSNSL